MKYVFMKQMSEKLLRVSSVLLSLLLLFICHPVLSGSGELYKWVDEKGTIHFTDRPSEVPPEYRNQIETKTFKKRSKPGEKPESETENTSKPAEPSKQPHSQVKNTSESAESPAVALERFEVPYKPFEGTGRRIIITVAFGGLITAPMLLDTGAPGMLISPNLADRLGLFDKRDGKLLIRAGGIGGSVPAILTIIDKVSVGGASAKFIPTTIAPMFAGASEGLVGMDFMANYKISIDTSKHVVTFEELPTKLEMPGGHDETWWRFNFRDFSKLRATWKEYLDKLEKVSIKTSDTKRLIRIAKYQHNQAEKLYRKLEQYAIHNSVPMHWREH